MKPIWAILLAGMTISAAHAQMTRSEAEAHLSLISLAPVDRDASVAVLMASDPQLADLIGAPKRTVAAAAIDEAQRRGRASLTPALAARSSSRADLTLSVQAAWALGRLGATSRSALRGLLTDPRPEVRTAAALGLVPFADRSTLPALHAAIDGPRVAGVPGDSRLRAAYALGRLGDRRAAPRVRALLTRLGDADQRFVCDVLGQFGDADSRAALRRVLRTARYGGTRVHAVRALGACAQRDDRPAILTALEDRASDVRLAAVRIVAAWNDPATRPALERVARTRAADFPNTGAGVKAQALAREAAAHLAASQTLSGQ